LDAAFYSKTCWYIIRSWNIAAAAELGAYEAWRRKGGEGGRERRVARIITCLEKNGGT